MMVAHHELQELSGFVVTPPAEHVAHRYVVGYVREADGAKRVVVCCACGLSFTGCGLAADCRLVAGNDLGHLDKFVIVDWDCILCVEGS